MRLIDLSEVKVGVVTRGDFATPWAHSGRDAIRIVNPIRWSTEIELLPDGHLIIYPGYMCDGPSGPTIDDATNREAAVVHDVAYQLLRMSKAPPSLTRKSADQLFHKMLLASGMPKWRAWYYYWGLRIGGASAAKPRKTEKKYTYLSS